MYAKACKVIKLFLKVREKRKKKDSVNRSHFVMISFVITFFF